MKLGLDLSNYAKKKNRLATGVDTSSLAKRFDFANLKSDLDKLNIGE